MKTIATILTAATLLSATAHAGETTFIDVHWHADARQPDGGDLPRIAEWMEQNRVERVIVMQYCLKFMIRHADRVMFGTDAAPWRTLRENEPPHEQFALIEALDLPPDVKAKICRGNAIALFSLEKEMEPQMDADQRR